MTSRDLSLIALFAAVIAALGVIPRIDVVPFIPVTAQSLGVMLAGCVLGWKRGALAVLLYMVLLGLGLPRLSGVFGIGAYWAPTTGYLFAWPVAAAVTGWLVEAWWNRLNWGLAFLAAIAGGISIVYAGGIAWLTLWTGKPLMAMIGLNIAFLPGDLIKAGIAAAVAVYLKRTYPLAQPA